LLGSKVNFDSFSSSYFATEMGVSYLISTGLPPML
jgi:hypothetical protein